VSAQIEQEIDDDDPYYIYAVFLLCFQCESCHREMPDTSSHERLTKPWYIDQARRARAEHWYIRPLTDSDAWPDGIWCKDCAAKLGLFTPSTADHT
jgi:hypothetical protein